MRQVAKLGSHFLEEILYSLRPYQVAYFVAFTCKCAWFCEEKPRLPEAPKRSHNGPNHEVLQLQTEFCILLLCAVRSLASETCVLRFKTIRWCRPSTMQRRRLTRGPSAASEARREMKAITGRSGLLNSSQGNSFIFVFAPIKHLIFPEVSARHARPRLPLRPPRSPNSSFKGP
jgi:hypothetical protein